MNKELEEAIKRIRILLQDSCECVECIKNKKAYEIVLDYIENSIPKEKVEKQLQELENMKVEGEVFKTAVNFAIKNIQELLEGK